MTLTTEYDHSTSEIGSAVSDRLDYAMFRHPTAKGHLTLPKKKDAKDGVITYSRSPAETGEANIAAHSSDPAKGHPGAQPRDNDLSPEAAQEFHDETLPQESAKTAHFCSMKITEDVRKYAAEQAISEKEELEKGMEEKSKA